MLKAPSQLQLEAIVKVLSLAENHQMWTGPMSRSPRFKDFVDEQYAAINQVRDFVEANGVRTMRSIMSEAVRKSTPKIK